MLEVGSVSLDGDSNRSLGDGSEELIAGIVGDTSVGGDTDSTLGFVSLALLLLNGLVGIACFSFKFVLLSILESPLLPSTFASVGLGVAINELLLGEGDELTGGNLVSTFHGTSGGERPAGTALSLVLDGGDSTSILPVDNIGEVIGGEGLNVMESENITNETAESLLFDFHQVGEEVVSNSVSVVSHVPFEDESFGFEEKFHSGFEFSHGGVGFSVVGDVVHELDSVSVITGKSGGKEG